MKWGEGVMCGRMSRGSRCGVWKDERMSWGRRCVELCVCMGGYTGSVVQLTKKALD